MSLVNLGSNFSNSHNPLGCKWQEHGFKKHKPQSELMHFMYSWNWERLKVTRRCVSVFTGIYQAILLVSNCQLHSLLWWTHGREHGCRWLYIHILASCGCNSITFPRTSWQNPRKWLWITENRKSWESSYLGLDPKTFYHLLVCYLEGWGAN